MSESLRIHVIVSEPFAENTYVVWREGRTDALVVDPGLDPDAILDFLRRTGLTVAALLNTHGHADHIAGNGALQSAFPDAPLAIGVGDAPLLGDPEANLSAPFGLPLTSPPADRTVAEGDVMEYADIRLEVFDIPGHSPGHVVFVHRSDPPIVFGGDVLFQGGIGRYDFPGGDGRLLLAGIRSKLLTLDPRTVVYPGHGPKTTVGIEARSNPYLRGS
jgi:glyoxylase-like metal-dependent hydrolase (beta-lactamase superfamily II)